MLDYKLDGHGCSAYERYSKGAVLIKCIHTYIDKCTGSIKSKCSKKRTASLIIDMKVRTKRTRNCVRQLVANVRHSNSLYS